MANRVWILGAQDPEMELIDRLLRQCGEAVIYATDSSGQRVHPGSAYRCPIPEVPEGSTVYAVECIDILPEGWVRIDHHRPGDPGYGRPPEGFFCASSVGQVLAELDRLGISNRLSAADNIEAIFAAAADHCLAAAYRGECPGVDPDELLHWRIKTRAAFQGRSEAELFADVYEAQDLLEDAPNERLAHGVYVVDMTGYGHVPELPEAAMLEGVAYITLVADRDGRRKIVLGGNTTPEIVRVFLDSWAPAQGLVDLYGDPARGFAGGYLPDLNPA